MFTFIRIANSNHCGLYNSMIATQLMHYERLENVENDKTHRAILFGRWQNYFEDEQNMIKQYKYIMFFHVCTLFAQVSQLSWDSGTGVVDLWVELWHPFFHWGIFLELHMKNYQTPIVAFSQKIIFINILTTSVYYLYPFQMKIKRFEPGQQEQYFHWRAPRF